MRKHRQPVASAVIALFVFLGLTLSPSVAQMTADEPLTIETAKGSFDYTVELALTAKERAVGLMSRESMEDDHGMLFRFESVRLVTMWMKDTLIPLDMIFIRADGTVAGVHENADPLSEKIISSPEPILYVLELNGGEAAGISLAEGDTISHPVIERTAAGR